MKHLCFILLFSFSSSWADSMKNGSPLESEVDQRLPRQNTLFIFERSSQDLPKEDQGLGLILSDIIEEGPSTMSADSFRDSLFSLNSNISISETRGSFILSVTAPQNHLKQALNLAMDTLQNPRWDSFEVMKNRKIQESKQRFEDMQSVIGYFALRDLFEYHPLTQDGTGTPKTVSSVNLEKTKNFFQSVFFKKTPWVASVGPMATKKLTQCLELSSIYTLFSKKYEPTSKAKIDLKKYTLKEDRVKIIHKAGATDHRVFWTYLDEVKPDSRDYVSGQVTHNLLGGGLSGRLGKTLRVERGLTYYAGSQLGRVLPVWLVISFASSSQIEGLLKGIPEVIEKFKKEKVEKPDLRQTLDSLNTDHLASIELPADRLRTRVGSIILGRNPKFIEEFPKMLKSISIGDVDQFRKQHLNHQKGYLYLMGDSSVLKPILIKLGIAESKIDVIDQNQI